MNRYKLIFIVSISGTILIGCDNAKDNAGSEKRFADEIVNSMISVKGGHFQMGDFGSLVGEKLPLALLRTINHYTGLSCLILK